ncbi:hypothetical protein [Nocardia neocaledoniensis]|uniref:hypothetical protein n=1 Tax=Nocardia neocaledoniensis TaxID=236511 RepID=UPI00245388CF|nr:hypothetical protein [Nocardia neocaledoniensis]
MFVPLFADRRGWHKAADPTRSLWDLRQVDVPVLPLVALVAVVLLVSAVGVWQEQEFWVPPALAGVAIATAGLTLLAVSAGFTLVISGIGPRKGNHAVTGSIQEIDVLPGLPLLLGGLAMMIVGTLGSWLLGALPTRATASRQR